jgi:endothelin-converting enzyme/putative endopeptidase
MRTRPAAAALACALAAAAASAQSLRSGLDVAGFDRAVAPQDDLYAHVNGAWLKRTVIPDDRVTYGAFAEIVDKTDRDLRLLIEETVARRDRPRGSPAQQIADLYTSTVDVAEIERRGAAAIRPQLQRFDAMRTTRDVAAEAGYLSSIAAGGPFAGLVGIDPLNPGAPVVRVSQGGILLPDRDYYLKDDPALAEIRAKYVEYLTHIFQLTGRAAPAEDAAAVLAFETALARISWPEAESRNLATTYTRFTLRQLASEMPGFDWLAWARPQGIDRSPAVILAQPSFFKAFAALIPSVPMSTLRAWLLARYVTAAAPYLNRAFDDARYDFFGVILTGQQRPRERWKRGVSMVNGYLGDALGRLYVERHFPQTTRARVQKMLANVLAAYRDALKEADWLSPSARREALEKLAVLSTGVGYPARWRDYRSLTIVPDDLIGNWQRALAFDNQYRLGNVGGSPGGEWAMPPQTVNAYYSPGANEMVLPAAIFQPPLFDPAADDAVNYGAAGSLIAHEIGHAFDDRGRRYDGSGAVRDWWTPGDGERYAERVARLSAQLDRYEPLPGLTINGPLTVAESLADLGGLAVALRAYRLSVKGGKAPVIDGLTGEQRFFMGWAQMWRAKERDVYVRSTLQTNPYLPPRLRANAAVRNVDGYFDAFGVKPGNRLYTAPAERIRIW